ncbi:MAG TPA: hypothetical protein VM324_05575, partial [Egibacteraceae bacterium]|nr:hypothetical protein [Egibacteraceae bacterium]
AAAGATSITPIVLHLRPGVRELFWPWLEAHHPELVDRYAELYTKATAAKHYRGPVEAFVAEQRRVAYRRHGRPAQPPAWRGRLNDGGRPEAAPTQLRLL